MVYAFTLSGDYPLLGKEEVVALERLHKNNYAYEERKLTVKKKINKNYFSRYAYVKKIYEDDSKIFENKEKFSARRPHLRPVLHPSSLQPKLARAMVNLSGAGPRKGQGIIHDPFCGTGGILIEAGLMGFRPVGTDNSSKMVDGCKKNLDYFGITNNKISAADALRVKLRGVIVTDLPYARNTRNADLERLYFSFFLRLKKHLKQGQRAVVGLPDFVHEKKLCSRAGLRISASFLYYLHRSLSKRILIVDKNKVL